MLSRLRIFHLFLKFICFWKWANCLLLTYCTPRGYFIMWIEIHYSFGICVYSCIRYPFIYWFYIIYIYWLMDVIKWQFTEIMLQCINMYCLAWHISMHDEPSTNWYVINKFCYVIVIFHWITNFLIINSFLILG